MDFSFLITISSGDDEFIKDFIETYEETAIPQIKQMQNAFDSKNFQLLGSLAHQLKPTGEMLGFSSQSDIISVNKSPNTTTQSQLDNIKAEIQEALDGLKSQFG